MNCFKTLFKQIPVTKLATAICISALGLLAACEKTINPNDLPVSYFADPKNIGDRNGNDPCSVASAQAILKSGLPYPHFTTYETTGRGGKPELRNKTVDVWVGSTRLVLPAELVRDNGMYAKNHPRRFWGLSGALPHFYPAGDPGPVVDGMGPMVDITIVCTIDPDKVASWGKGNRSNEEGIDSVKKRYEEDLKQRGQDKWPLAKVSVSRRADLEMTEVLYERGGIYNDNQPMWEANYWPLKIELKGPSGEVSSIGCTTRHDPQKR